MANEITQRPDKYIERSRVAYIVDIKNTLKDIERFVKYTESEGLGQLKVVRDLLDDAYCTIYKARRYPPIN